MGETIRDAWRWRGWWAKRHGRSVAFGPSPFLGVKPIAVARWRPHWVLFGISVQRDNDEEWEIAVGLWLVSVVVVMHEYGPASEDQ